MLGKLIKHDFRALSRTLFPLQVGILGGGLVATLFMTINMRLSVLPADIINPNFKMILTGLTTMLLVIIGLCIAASALVTLLLVCIQFYRNLMSSQGYLTFTLPVTTGRILWSKLITGMIWVAINAVVVIVTVLIFAVFGTASSGFANPRALDFLREGFAAFSALGAYAPVGTTLIVLEGIVYTVVALATSLLQAYFAIAIGGRATKHRLLASVGMYIALSMGMSMISTFLTLTGALWPSVAILSAAAAETMTLRFVHFVIIGGSVLNAAFGVLFFIFARLLMKNKLNLQ